MEKFSPKIVFIWLLSTKGKVGARLPVYTFLYSFDFWTVNICSKINNTKAEKNPFIFPSRCRSLWLKELSSANWVE